MDSKLIDGVRKFHREVFLARHQVYEHLAEEGQHPRILFFTCSDSRIEPEVMTQTQPGELFVVRNAGNLIPPHTPHHPHAISGEEASIDYAITVLGVRELVVCGHSHCGAMEHLLGTNTLCEGRCERHAATAPCNDTLREWLQHGAASLEALYQTPDLPHLTYAERVERLARLNIATQLGHLKTIPSVARALAEGRLELCGWYYCLEKGSVEVFDFQRHQFIPVV